uniref:Uncharacterized protein n=1 Tax=Arundo donax TaxID=35708 RepID=A0A0A9FEW6_ARUDO
MHYSSFFPMLCGQTCMGIDL